MQLEWRLAAHLWRTESANQVGRDSGKVKIKYHSHTNCIWKSGGGWAKAQRRRRITRRRIASALRILSSSRRDSERASGVSIALADRSARRDLFILAARPATLNSAYYSGFGNSGKLRDGVESSPRVRGMTRRRPDYRSASKTGRKR